MVQKSKLFYFILFSKKILANLFRKYVRRDSQERSCMYIFDEQGTKKSCRYLSPLSFSNLLLSFFRVFCYFKRLCKMIRTKIPLYNK